MDRKREREWSSTGRGWIGGEESRYGGKCGGKGNGGGEDERRKILQTEKG